MTKRLQWTPELVSKFWDGVAKSPGMESLSFAKLAGPSLIALMSPWVRDGARCLDFGGGSGAFVEQMIAAGFDTALYEPSAERKAHALPGLAGNPRFLGVRTPADDDQFDFIVCSEVIEHVLDQDFDSFMRALIGRIAPGGRLIITTPMNENLEQNDCYCPVCDHLFHRWQHQRSWAAAQLEGLMQRWGLTTTWIGEVSFHSPDVMREYHQARAEGRDGQWPHANGLPYIYPGGSLVYVGDKPA